MILVTRFDHSEIYINADLIEFVESTPDTIITTLTGRKLLVRESAAEVRDRIVKYRIETGGSALRSYAASVSTEQPC